MAHAIVYVDDIDIPSVLNCYGYDSLEEVKTVYGAELEQILAECEFELEAQTGECFTGPIFKSYSELDKLIMYEIAGGN